MPTKGTPIRESAAHRKAREARAALVYAHEPPRRHVIHPGPYVVLVGDIVSGFEAFGPFESGTDAVRWKQNKGVREFTQGQWFLLPLKEVV